MKSSANPAPSIVPGRRGGRSIADVLVETLWSSSTGKWPQCTFTELREKTSACLGYDVSASTIRSTIYGHPQVFERTDSDQARYQIAKGFRRR